MQKNLEEKIQSRIEQLKAERDQLIQLANQQIGAYNAVIAELGKLLEEPAEDTVPQS